MLSQKLNKRIFHKYVLKVDVSAHIDVQPSPWLWDCDEQSESLNTS